MQGRIVLSALPYLTFSAKTDAARFVQHLGSELNLKGENTMPHFVLSVKIEKETLDTFRSLRDLKGCTMSALLGDVLNDYVELGLAQAEMEGEIEAQTGVLLDHMTGLPEGPQLLS